jgi:hypothetical protein
MKKFLIAINLVIWSLVGFQVSSYAAGDDRVRVYEVPTPTNENCVKRDKNNKCPPLPNSPKPTPKKPTEKSAEKK